MSFPDNIPDLSQTRADEDTDPLSTPNHLTHHTAEDDFLTAVAGLVGTYSSQIQTSHNYKLALILGIYHAIATGGEQFIWGLKRFLDRIYIPSSYGVLKTAQDAANIVFNIRESTRWMVTLGGNRTLDVTDVEEGQCFMIRLVQDGSGSRTVTWWSGITWITSDGNAPTLKTAGGKVDTLGFLKTGANAFDGYIMG